MTNKKIAASEAKGGHSNPAAQNEEFSKEVSKRPSGDHMSHAGRYS